MKITVDGTKCQRYGQCELEAPDVFTLPAEGPSQVLPTASEEHLDDAFAAADLCPMQAISVEE